MAGFGLRVVGARGGKFSVLVSVLTEAHGLGMARRSEKEMWKTFRVLDEQMQMLSLHRDSLEDREAGACQLADLIDMRVIHLTKKYKRLLQDEDEAEGWVADVESLGVKTPREKKRESNAREALAAIRKEIRQLSARAHALDEKRWLWRQKEHQFEEGQYVLEESIDQLKEDMERVLSEGAD